MSEIAVNRVQARALRVPLRERVNIRMIVFILVLGGPFVWLAWVYISDMMNQGIVGKRGDYTEVELKWMSTFDFDQVNGKLTDVPQRWRELDGKKVILRGEIYAPDTAAPDISRFDLCYSIAKCCVSSSPLVQHFVKSQAINGTVPYYTGLVEVRGTLHVNVVPGEGKIASVYQMDVESVEPVN